MKIGNLVEWHGQFASIFELEGSIGVILERAETIPSSWWVQIGSERFSIPENNLRLLSK